MSYLDETITAVEMDDLTRIEGISLSVAAILNDAGIHSFADLSAMPAVKIKEILVRAGARSSFYDPYTWPRQAAFATSGQWGRLLTWQEELRAGRVRMAAAADEEE